MGGGTIQYLLLHIITLETTIEVAITIHPMSHDLASREPSKDSLNGFLVPLKASRFLWEFTL